MERHILLSLIIIVFMSCKTVKKESDPGDQVLTKQDTTVQLYVFKECASKDDCVVLFDCYSELFLRKSLINYKTWINQKYFDFDKFMYCAVHVFKNDSLRRKAADQCIYNYCMESYRYNCIEKGKSIMPTGNLSDYIFKDWNSRRAFDAFILLMSKNYHDSMGHGDCTNVGVKFFDQIVLPKIKTIDGVDFWTYFDRNNKGDHGPADCYDSFYEALYPLLKKAWEEGKIELHAPEIK